VSLRLHAGDASHGERAPRPTEELAAPMEAAFEIVLFLPPTRPTPALSTPIPSRSMAFTDLVNAFVKSFITPLSALMQLGGAVQSRGGPKAGVRAAEAMGPRSSAKQACRQLPLTSRAPHPRRELPAVAAIFRGVSFSDLYFTVNSSRFLYGEAINALIVFLLVICERRGFGAVFRGWLVLASSNATA